MKNYNNIRVLAVFFLSLGVLVFSACERDFSDDVEFATIPPNGDVFLDAFSAGLDYFPFVGAGADPEAFSVETDEVFLGDASMRFDVPAFGNGFVGATFNTTALRDLSGFDALTFYAKASQAASINSIGFGINEGTGNRYITTVNGLNVSTRWEKYVIPIPESTNLTSELGLFWLAEGASFEGDEGGYVLFFDEVQFEKLGNVAQAQPSIFNGEDRVETSFVGSSITVTGLSQTFNLASGENQTVEPAPAYFQFSSSDESVAIVSELGVVSVVGAGTAEISAQLAGVRAQGSLTIESQGEFVAAPAPTRDPANVISIFSDSYANVPVNFFNGFFDGQSTEGGALTIGDGINILQYTNLDFVAPEFTNPTVDITQMTHIHVDIQVSELLQGGDNLVIELVDFGGNQTFDFGGDDSAGSATVNGSDLATNSWVGFDIPIASFTGPATGGAFSGGPNGANLAQIVFVSGSISDILVDNIYFYRE